MGEHCRSLSTDVDVESNPPASHSIELVLLAWSSMSSCAAAAATVENRRNPLSVCVDRNMTPEMMNLNN